MQSFPLHSYVSCKQSLAHNQAKKLDPDPCTDSLTNYVKTLLDEKKVTLPCSDDRNFENEYSSSQKTVRIESLSQGWYRCSFKVLTPPHATVLARRFCHTEAFIIPLCLVCIRRLPVLSAMAPVCWSTVQCRVALLPRQQNAQCYLLLVYED